MKEVLDDSLIARLRGRRLDGGEAAKEIALRDAAAMLLANSKNYFQNREKRRFRSNFDCTNCVNSGLG
jgi:hypothetical protein